MFFDNVLASKRDIYKNLKDKYGVYIFINKNTKDHYVGSSVNLSKRRASQARFSGASQARFSGASQARFSGAAHFYHARSNKKTSIIFYRAMRKYGLENFSLGILEFCTSDVTDCSKLEQKWIDLYKPEYNMFKEARSSTGFSHSVETISNLKQMFSKENHPK